MQQVEEERGEPGSCRRGVLEQHRAPVRTQRERLPVQHEAERGQGCGGRDHGRQAGGDVVEAAAVHRDLVALAVHLDADAVELGLHGHRRPSAEPLEGGRDVGRGGRQHRQHRTPDLQGDLRQRSIATGCCRDGDDGDRPGEHGRPPHRVHVDGESLGDGRQEHPFECALTGLSGDQAGEEVLLGRGGAAHQFSQQPLPGALRPGSCEQAQLGERRVHLDEGESGLCAGSGRPTRERQPTPVRRCRSEPER